MIPFIRLPARMLQLHQIHIREPLMQTIWSKLLIGGGAVIYGNLRDRHVLVSDLKGCHLGGEVISGMRLGGLIDSFIGHWKLWDHVYFIVDLGGYVYFTYLVQISVGCIHTFTLFT